jgi:hypothetical protein
MSSLWEELKTGEPFADLIRQAKASEVLVNALMQQWNSSHHSVCR